ncbi:hypothetical protein EJ02DRAFT_131435 [Clathrospora elynae]|uniref:Endonuclease/exonuclease/phosphatase domain-containing protein n=1 Tax=Clathrospora elynae TaxID=706981 RepID=A0A6A5SD79_9PLEO|nr:hypothetical protein EJ02DRAFT_131435 [Clathrospora elynae]
MLRTARNQPIKFIRLVSWNIDMQIPFAEERMSAALHYLNQLLSPTPPEVAVVVFLQEMTMSDVQQIRHSPWIKQRLKMTETDTRHWLSPYGTTTLVDRRLCISSVFRVPWISKFGRDGLFVDIALSHPQIPHVEGKVLRLCNTHLESLVADPPVRPVQLSAASTYLKKPEVACALIAGDLNAIQPFDRALHWENNLQDMYLELGGAEDSDEGYTWGYQSPELMRYRYGCCRMDKILYRGDLQPKKFERIGMGVKVAEEHMKKVTEMGQLEWVTDHYGVMGEFEITEDWMLLEENTQENN